MKNLMKSIAMILCVMMMMMVSLTAMADENMAQAAATEIAAEQETVEIAAKETTKVAATAKKTTKKVTDGRKVTISMKLLGDNDTAEMGDKVKMTAKLTGFKKVSYKLQWQVKTPNGKWTNIKGATKSTYTYTINADTLNCSWRVKVVTAD